MTNGVKCQTAKTEAMVIIIILCPMVYAAYY